MPRHTILYKLNSATTQQVSIHLSACNDQFIPPLDTLVDINEYVKKIKDKATCFEAWDQTTLVGLVATYFNDETTRSAFITNVSVLPEYSGQGIAVTLLTHCINYAREKDFYCIRLEVNKQNQKAINLYKRAKFNLYNSKEQLYLMQFDVKPEK